MCISLLLWHDPGQSGFRVCMSLPLKHGVYCRVLNGVMFQKDVVAPGRMRRKIHKPRILLLDCPLEYKKGENQTNVEIEKEEDW